MPKLPPPDADCPADAAGGGQCPLSFCGAPKTVSALALGEPAQLGADAICTPGYVCVPDGPTATGDALELRCIQPSTSAAAFGAACSKGAGAANRCADDGLCIESAAAPGQSFCSSLCRVDADCPANAYCLEYQSAPLPDGSYVELGYCTPVAKIAGTVCARESDCPADEGCVAVSTRTQLQTCQKVGGTKSTGDACAATSDCRSGQCYDRDFHVAANRSFCSAMCAKSSDCGADQRCARIVLNNNDTPTDPRDDLVVGLCQSLFVSIATAGCHSNGDCTQNGADTCSIQYGLCYKAGAPSGAACTDSVGCDLGAVCTVSPRFPGGYCQTFGCAPGAAPGTVDSCPGPNATCAQRGTDVPLNACYEGCATTADCSRASQQYLCEAPSAPSTTDGGAGDGATGGSSDGAVEAGPADGAAGDGASDGEAGATEAGPEQFPLICIFDQGA
jgi:hypothetical protein